MATGDDGVNLRGKCFPPRRIQKNMFGITPSGGTHPSDAVTILPDQGEIYHFGYTFLSQRKLLAGRVPATADGRSRYKAGLTPEQRIR